MNPSPRQMKLGMFMREAGHHIAAWRTPEAPKSPGNNLAHNIEVAQLAESGLFDMLFISDGNGVPSMDAPEMLEANCITVKPAVFEPVTFLSAVPITQTEGAWVRLKGGPAMRQAWSDDGVDVLDPGRPAAR